ncbi:hypothetical protein N7468_003672 [Penicillium chermesinum]|uniref:Alcohol dehydrogenase iron-type/glycerol dehydrogenase GldA domain-containing protein n=1 Tax=Penicillium chermesinum TaxID=63820 RepID=A0A9W9P9I0_9EURO|nr:uncharacterized protein N7468_003672 [Penicillium chermesinum]KAJ5239053.1 hypothetical protein N7468_003672 [Penicillium chermesinum]
MTYQDPRNVSTGGIGKMQASLSPLYGQYVPNKLKSLYYGSDVVKLHLLSCLPSETSKAFIITGTSLATSTSLIKDLEELLSPKHHAGTYAGIKAHSPQTQIDDATSIISQDESIDTIISVGGGSPMDSAKNMVYQVREATGRLLSHITIPTTLSAGECTPGAGFTKEDGVKGIRFHADLYVSYIFYDPKFALPTPPTLWLSTGIRALDHAVETQYHPSATWIPSKMIALNAIAQLFRLLPAYVANPTNEDTITACFLAVYASLGFFGQNIQGGLGLSHSLGYALGSPYGIGHGYTSCISLPPVVKLKARESKQNAASIAAILPFIGEEQSGDDVADADLVSERITGLIEQIGLKTDLTAQGVSKSEADIIAARATRLPFGGETPDEKQLWKSVRELVDTLW